MVGKEEIHKMLQWKGQPFLKYDLRDVVKLKSVKGAILLAVLRDVEQTNQRDIDSEWFVCTTDEITQRSGLTYDNQRSGMRVLREHEVVETKLFGLPARRYFKLKSLQ